MLVNHESWWSWWNRWWWCWGCSWWACHRWHRWNRWWQCQRWWAMPIGPIVHWAWHISSFRVRPSSSSWPATPSSKCNRRIYNSSIFNTHLYNSSITLSIFPGLVLSSALSLFSKVSSNGLEQQVDALHAGSYSPILSWCFRRWRWIYWDKDKDDDDFKHGNDNDDWLQDVEDFVPVYQDTTDPASQFKTVLAKSGFAIRQVFLLHMGYLLLLSKTQFKSLLVKD